MQLNEVKLYRRYCDTSAAELTEHTFAGRSSFLDKRWHRRTGAVLGAYEPVYDRAT
jgi:hypothetical protein